MRRFELKLSESGMGEEARREADKVLNRMKQEGKDSHEYGALYDYLDFVTTLAWKMDDPAPVDLDEAEKILDEDHYGLKKVKERIVQQLAVMALNKKQSGSVLLFVGAPGTGKTSIGQSIARALHRSMCASAWAASGTRLRSEATGEPTSGLCPAGSCRVWREPAS